MDFSSFVNSSGLKVLAMARLQQCEYVVMLYLLNAAASGLQEFITTERELSSLIGFPEKDVRDAINHLAERFIITIKVGDHSQTVSHRQSIRIGVQFDIKEWLLDFDEDVTSHDAIVFPFRRGENLHLVAASEQTEGHLGTKITKSLPTWKRVFNEYSGSKNLNEREITKAEADAKILVDTHPVDQVLLMLRHFNERIPTLSLLASSWQHYQEVFEEETQKVDLMGARQKHIELDEKFREAVSQCLEERDKLGLASEEVTVLEILCNHRHPRRQLFWAYQSRGRYPNLRNFFEEYAKLMLPVTSTGIVFKKRPHQD